ncbi:MAG TPA: Gfo/Idh/MocA family oxidoreductase [Chloroflexota bacterium]|nr:Gfo/Idh/MocA family oxidoreductase [Chloroflexota bacterium]
MAQKQHRIGIAGFDHWYIARGVVDACTTNPRATVTAVAHRDEATITQYAKEKSIPFATTDYAAIAARDDVEVLVTACPTSENVALCIDAAKRGKPILSVKPCAMTVADADRLAKAVNDAGVAFYPFESYNRVGAQNRGLKAWLAEGKIGKPISATIIQRAGLGGASQDWPGRRNDNTWWRTPSMVPGGGWLDHAIYQIDALRFLLDDEVARIGGVAKTLAHPELQAPWEDFGVAIVEFKKGLVATIEVTWTAPASGGLSQTQIVGTEGQIVYDPTVTGRVAVSGKFDGPAGGGWTSFAPPWRGGATPLDHVLDVIEGKAQPAATVADARANVAACLAFYEAARTGRTVSL